MLRAGNENQVNTDQVNGETLIVRADSNTEIGVGHVMRCIALAQAWQDAGGRALFLLGSDCAEIEQRIHAENMGVARLAATPGSTQDSEETARISQHNRADWLVLDGYHFPAEYRRRIAHAAPHLLVVDDHGEFPPYDCDIVLNIHPYACDQIYPERCWQTRFLLGPKYALLRREFALHCRSKSDVAEKARKILVTFGGGDLHNVTLQVLEGLQEVGNQPLEVTVLVGASNPHRASLEAAVRDSPPVRLLWNITNVSEWMTWADLAISAGGATYYESAFLSVPVVLVIMAKNHEHTVEAIAQRKAAVNAGWFHSLGRHQFASLLRRVIEDRRLRKELVNNAARMVDGNGAKRVAQSMLAVSASRSRVIT